MTTIWVTPHPSLRAQNRVALYEVHPAHPKGEIAIDGGDAGPHEVGESPGLLEALAPSGPGQPPRLIRVEAPSKAEREAMQKAQTSSSQSGQTGTGEQQQPDPFAFLTDGQRAALAAAGFGTPEAIRNASDAQLDAVPGIGDGIIAPLREASKE